MSYFQVNYSTWIRVFGPSKSLFLGLRLSRLFRDSHRINNYIEDKTIQIVFQLENFMSFWLEFVLFYTVHSVHYSTQISPTSPEEDRAHILSENMDVCDKDKNSLLLLVFVGINVETVFFSGFLMPINFLTQSGR